MQRDSIAACRMRKPFSKKANSEEEYRVQSQKASNYLRQQTADLPLDNLCLLELISRVILQVQASIQVLLGQ